MSLFLYGIEENISSHFIHLPVFSLLTTMFPPMTPISPGAMLVPRKREMKRLPIVTDIPMYCIYFLQLNLTIKLLLLWGRDGC